MKTYLCSYFFNNERYGFEIKADSMEEAKDRLVWIKMCGKLDGELKMTVPASMGWVARLLCWLLEKQLTAKDKAIAQLQQDNKVLVEMENENEKVIKCVTEYKDFLKNENTSQREAIAAHEKDRMELADLKLALWCPPILSCFLCGKGPLLETDLAVRWRDSLLGFCVACQSQREQLGRMEEALKELKEYVRYSTLEIQSHMSRTDKQKDNLFQYGYRLYIKYDVENKHALRGKEEG